MWLQRYIRQTVKLCFVYSGSVKFVQGPDKIYFRWTCQTSRLNKPANVLNFCLGLVRHTQIHLLLNSQKKTNVNKRHKEANVEAEQTRFEQMYHLTARLDDKSVQQARKKKKYVDI